MKKSIITKLHLIIIVATFLMLAIILWSDWQLISIVAIGGAGLAIKKMALPTLLSVLAPGFILLAAIKKWKLLWAFIPLYFAFKFPEQLKYIRLYWNNPQTNSSYYFSAKIFVWSEAIYLSLLFIIAITLIFNYFINERK